MEFVNQFVVPAPVADAWKLLCDVPTIAPCLPGAQVRPLDDGTYEGTVSIKVGPMKAGYQGIASFAEIDEDRHVMVLDARGSETNGKGSAAAVVRVSLSEKGPDATLVDVVTELQVTGRIAQFGRSIMADVGARLIGQFASNIEHLLGRTPTSEAVGGAATAKPSIPSAAQNPDSELDLISLGLPTVKRAAPALIALIIGLIIGRILSRGSRQADQQTPDFAALYPFAMELARQFRGSDEPRPRF
ncbi:SRPBCC family protein [Mycolicibacterium wolinskyi]|uniref:SRPBCC family protein n=1 Tax=Mycolicibacterium wolinskyi TaxID=59750 RepID=UPI0008316547|nr:SRPBCC family protein [Mycolicibacterium wolinskyi]